MVALSTVCNIKMCATKKHTGERETHLLGVHFSLPDNFYTYIKCVTDFSQSLNGWISADKQ